MKSTRSQFQTAGRSIVGGFRVLPAFCAMTSTLLALPSVAALSAPPMADAEAISVSEKRIADAIENGSTDSPGQVVVVYFTPRDRKPAAGHPERVRRIVQTTADFYEQALAKHGFPDRRMSVARDDDGEIKIFDVVGRDLDKDYGKPDGDRIRKEVVPVLRADGINPEQIVMLLFCNLMDYDAEKGSISHHSPYYGGGTHLTGTAWQCDSEILDPLRFTDATPILDGEYGRISVGRHNSIFIGGVIHELGHALSLPHCRQRADEAKLGTALMGSGNRTFAQEKRGEGRGTFLTQAHALRLAAHPVFNKRVASTLRARPRIETDELRVDVTEGDAIRVRGKIEASVPIHGMIAYFDPAGGGDYDATTATAVPSSDGVYAMSSGALRPGRSGQLRLVACHVNGATTERALSYRVDRRGRPDLSTIRLDLELAPMVEALRKGDLTRAEEQLNDLARDGDELMKIGRRTLQRFLDREKGEPASIDPASVPEEQTTIRLSRLRPEFDKVGWIRPTYDRVPDSTVLLSVGGEYHASGIYAHAPAQHAYKIAGRWKRLSGSCGLQSGRAGKVDFRIIGDGKLLWKTQGVRDGDAIDYSVDLSDVQQLNLIVTDGGNGTGSDWGVWIEPTLSR